MQPTYSANATNIKYFEINQSVLLYMNFLCLVSELFARSPVRFFYEWFIDGGQADSMTKLRRQTHLKAKLRRSRHHFQDLGHSFLLYAPFSRPIRRYLLKIYKRNYVKDVSRHQHDKNR